MTTNSSKKKNQNKKQWIASINRLYTIAVVCFIAIMHEEPFPI